MLDESDRYALVYVEADIPPGLTIEGYRARRGGGSARRPVRTRAGAMIARIRVRVGRHRAQRHAAPTNQGLPA